MSVIEPSKMPVPFASVGLKNPIPANSDPVTGRAGYNQGFPAINMTAKEAGGIPPYGQDFNGILFDITNALRFTQQGGIYTYDLTFAEAIGGYTKSAVLCGKTTTALYQNQVDGNLTDPEGEASAGWLMFGPSSYGLPMIGELVMWPNASMPQEIWPDIGAKFIPYMGQPFSTSLYPLLAQLHPSGVLPADMRAQFVRGWDNSRGIDSGRQLMKGQAATAVGRNVGIDGATPASSFIEIIEGENPISLAGFLKMSPGSPTNTGTMAYRVRPANIAWNLIVRAS